MRYTLSSYSDSGLLSAVAFITPTVAVIAPLQLPTVAVIAAALVIVFRIINGGPWPFGLPKITLALVAMVAWSSTSSIWAVDPKLSISAATRLMLAAGTLVVLLDASTTIDANDKKILYRWSGYGAFIGITLILLTTRYIYFTMAWEEIEATVNSLNRSASIISIFAWPWALSIGRQYGSGWTGAFIVAVVVSLYFLSPTTPFLAFWIGTCAFVMAWVAPKWAKIILLIILLLCVGIIPFLNEVLPYINDYLSHNFPAFISVIHRFVIWQFVSDQILIKPIIGWGLDTARVFPNGDMSLFLVRDTSGQPVMGEALPLHPHNAIIQIWLELGLIGVFLFFTIITLTIKGIPSNESRKLDPAVCVATIATALVITQLGYGFWQGWWLATLGLAAVTTVALTWRPDP